MKTTKSNKNQSKLIVSKRTNILKVKCKSKPRKRAKSKDIKSLSQLVDSLGNVKISYLESPSGTIECVETVRPTIDTKTHIQEKPIVSTGSSLSRELKSKTCLKRKTKKIKTMNPRNSYNLSVPNCSTFKGPSDITGNNSNRRKKVVLKEPCLGNLVDVDGSIHNQSVTPRPSQGLSEDLINKACVKSQKYKIRNPKAEKSQPSSSLKNSIIKMTHDTEINKRGNAILHTLCSDKTKKNDNREFSLIQSLLLTGNKLNETLIKENNTENVLGLDGISGLSKNEEKSASKTEKSPQPSSNEKFATRIISNSSNSPVCSIFVNSNGTNSVANFYELAWSKFMVLMKPDSILPIIGTVEIQLLKGSLEILGYHSFKEEEKLLIFSLQGSSHLALKAKEPLCEKKSDKNLFDKLIGLGLPEQLSLKVSKKAGNSILFTVTRNKTDVSSTVWPNFFENHSSFFVFPNTHIFYNGSRPCHVVERKIKCLFESNLQDLGFKMFYEVPEWSEIENDIMNRDYPKTILGGGKSVGKSTLLRYLVNKFLFKWRQILVLDFDLGQCEFTVPGCISATLVEAPLLGPNYSHLKEPERSVFLGEVDVTKCPQYYIEGCKSLIDYARAEHNDIPWLINTMGFTKGFGVSLACGIINYVRPTHVIQIQSKDRKLNFPSLLEPKFVNCLKHSAFDVMDTATMNYQLHEIPSGSEHPGFVSKSRGISPAESRNLVILSYMSKMLSSNVTSLSDVTPYMISMEQVDLQTTNQHNLTKVQVAAAMNGNMVALCHKSSTNQIPNCRGFGIVRAVDWHNGNIFLITPLPLPELNRVNCLVKGNVALPDSLYYNQGNKVTGHVPYLAHTSGGSTARFAKRDYRNLPVTHRDNRQYR